MVAALAALRGSRLAGLALGAVAAAAAFDDLPPQRRALRRVLPKRSVANVVATVGPEDAPRTVVLVAHHDAAHSGLVFHPAIPERLFGLFPTVLERNDTSPPLMAPVVGGPALAAAGALTGSRALARAGLVLSAGSALAMADIGTREVVPGANDNATGVATLVAIARAVAEQPDREPPGDARLDLRGGDLRGDAGLCASVTSRSCRSRAPSCSRSTPSARRT